MPIAAGPYRPQLPDGAVLDGEIVIASPEGQLDFDSLLLRIHPAESRIKLLASQTPASYVAFDQLAADGVTRRHLVIQNPHGRE